MDQEKIKALGARLKEKRTQQGLTQKELADRLGIGFSTLQALELGVSKALGKRVKSIVEHYIQGEESSSAVTTEDLDPLLLILAKIICDENFENRIHGISELLSINKEDATVIVLREALKKNKFIT